MAKEVTLKSIHKEDFRTHTSRKINNALVELLLEEGNEDKCL